MAAAGRHPAGQGARNAVPLGYTAGMTLPPNAPVLAHVRPDWVDNNGHMNMGFYLVVFDMATDQLWGELGLGAPFRAQGLGTFAAEAWVNYVRELHEGMPLASTSEILGYDGKRMLSVHRLYHATEGWLAAENEVLYLCIDLAVRRVTTWPDAMQQRFAARATGAAPKRLALGRRS
jgi:acyl-CoA thioester hydrolase